MTLTQLANFVRIAELQSLSKAAAVIRIAQPALSRQVRILEDELGSALLIRHAWGVTLTGAGEILLVHARCMILEAQRARDAVLEAAAVPSGQVRFAVPSSLATTLIPPLSASLRELYPKLAVHFVDGFSAVLHKRTLSNEIDLAILYQDRAMGPLATTPLLVEPLVLVGPPQAEFVSGPLGTMLAELPIVLPAPPNRLRIIVDEALAFAGVLPSSITEVDSLPAILGIVQAGGAFTVLPYSSVANAVLRCEISACTFSHSAPTRTLLLARRLDRAPTIGVDAVEAEVRKLVAKLAPSLHWKILCA